MSKNNDEFDHEPKAPYEPPAVVAEEVFQTLAMTCGKTNGEFLCDPETSGSPFSIS